MPEKSWSGAIWNLVIGEKELELIGNSNPLEYIFSPNGRYVTVVMRNGAIRLWDVELKTELFDWLPLPEEGSDSTALSHIAFTTDSRFLAASVAKSHAFRLLELTKLRQQLNEYGLSW